LIFTIPVEFIGEVGCPTLTVELPLIKFCNTYSIINNQITFETNLIRTPQKLIITYHSDVSNSCIIHQPKIETSIVKNAPVRTISLKKNNEEIAISITNLSEQWNYKSWPKPWLSNNESIVYRYYWDYEAVKNMQS